MMADDVIVTCITPILRPLRTAAQARAIDRHTIDVVGVPGLVLMEHAGRAVCDVVFAHHRGGVVVVVCGGGNNGGDGFVCARHLLGRGVHVVVFTTRARASLTGDAATAAQLLDKAVVVRGLDSAVVVTAFDADRLAALRPTVVVDALFGTGLSRALDDDSTAVVTAIANARAGGATVIAVDVPSGLPTDGQVPHGAVVDADITVTFGEKIAHASEPGAVHCGRVVDVDIGFVASAEVVDAVTICALDGIRLPPLDTSAHKNRYGHVGVVVGGDGTRGAALLSARAAQRTGAGLVTLLGHATMLRPDGLMGRDLDDDDAFNGLDVVVIGPGLPPKVALSLRQRLRAARDHGLQVVADAGALGALIHGDADVWTPHPGEAARVLGVDNKAIQGDRISAARALVKALGGVVVLKGACPIVATSSQLVVVEGGSVAMAVAGSGDVLTGVIAAALGGALGAGTTASRAIAAVHLHQQAGKGQARGLFACELADHVRHAVAVARGG